MTLAYLASQFCTELGPPQPQLVIYFSYEIGYKNLKLLKYFCIQNKAMNISFQDNLLQDFLDDYCQKYEAKTRSNNQMHFC